MVSLTNPMTWVVAAFILLVVLVLYKKLPGMLGKALDKRAERIRIELEEARALRTQAEELLASYRQKQEEALKEAETILASARADAEEMKRIAQSDLKLALDARMKMAMEKIQQEEAKAIQDVQNHVVDISVAAARAIITEQLGKQAGDELIKIAIADIGHKIH